MESFMFSSNQARRLGKTAVLALAALLLACAFGGSELAPAQDKGGPAAPKVGVVVNEAKAFQGYTLVFPTTSKKTYLVDMKGKVIQTWEGADVPGLSAYLLPNGHLLRPCKLSSKETPFSSAPAAGGRIQEFTWDGELVWDFKLANDRQLQHHDICKLPNGNVLLIVFDRKAAQEAAAA